MTPFTIDTTSPHPPVHHPAADQATGTDVAALVSLNTVYDRQTVEVMRRVLRHDSSGVDMGAHRGDILRHMVTLAPAGIHHAFEALPHLAASLRIHFPGVRVHEVAVSDASGDADFMYVENAPAYSITAIDVYDLVTGTLGYELSTMGRWLERASPLTPQEFRHDWDHDLNFYFIATPAGLRA